MRACCPGFPATSGVSPAGVRMASRLPATSGTVFRRQSCPSLCSRIPASLPRQPPQIVPAPVRRINSSTVSMPRAAIRNVVADDVVHPHTTSAPPAARTAASSSSNSPAARKASICSVESEPPRNSRPIASESRSQFCGAVRPSSWPEFSPSMRIERPSGDRSVLATFARAPTTPATIISSCGYWRTRTTSPLSS